jgi:hypothetical protein
MRGTHSWSKRTPERHFLCSSWVAAATTVCGSSTGSINTRNGQSVQHHISAGCHVVPSLSSATPAYLHRGCKIRSSNPGRSKRSVLLQNAHAASCPMDTNGHRGCFPGVKVGVCSWPPAST